MSNSAAAAEKYGWTAVPRKVELLLQQSEASGPAKPISISSIQVPDSVLVKAVHEYAKKELAIETFNHSMRVFYYGNPPSFSWVTKAYQLVRTSYPHPCVFLLEEPNLQ
jgi:hypothetical protein